MVTKKIVKGHMRKVPGSRRKIRVPGHMREVDGRLKANR